jgi:protocatechuate 3,4-dioxygenase beta subunit
MRRAAVIAATAVVVLAAGCGGKGSSSPPTQSGSSTSPRTSASSPATRCVPGRLTPEQTEGPFYKAGSPERERVDQGATGQALVLEGHVFSTRCRPVAHARMEFWQADGRGSYDNAGYRLRGHEFTDAQGRYRLTTVYPGLYTGRTRHIHVKVQPPGGRVLTTQLYFPNEPGNQRDGIFRPDLVMQMKERGVGAFDFVV